MAGFDMIRKIDGRLVHKEGWKCILKLIIFGRDDKSLNHPDNFPECGEVDNGGGMLMQQLYKGNEVIIVAGTIIE